jgi:hypothetical protein
MSAGVFFIGLIVVILIAAVLGHIDRAARRDREDRRRK